MLILPATDMMRSVRIPRSHVNADWDWQQKLAISGLGKQRQGNT